MKRGIMKTALSVFLAAAVALCISLPAFAMSGETAGTSLLFTYYDLRSTAAGGLGLTDNYFTVTNTATDRWVQAHVRVRTGAHSIELLDFDVLLSPTDVFTFDLYDNAGATEFASCDIKTLLNSGFDPNFNRDGNTATGDAQGDDCYVLNNNTPGFDMLALINICEPDLTDAAALANTKKGYVEVIGEGIIRALNYYNSTASKEKCRGLLTADSSDDVTIAGKMLEYCSTDTLNLSVVCPNNDVDAMENVLIGRQYYASVPSGVVTRAAQVNAEVLDDYAPLTLHCENFALEAASNDCSAADQGPCYAYIDPTTGDTVDDGADDMNRCFYKAKITDANDVANKFGAGATFGPTIADIQVDGQRNGTCARTASALDYIMSYMNDGYATYNGGGFYSWGNKQYADSHYFAIPSVDVVTSFAFIFPLQHFIGEKDLVTPVVIYDLEENSKTVDLGKFISPGLPTPTSPADEAQLFKLTAPYSEGWVRWKVIATNSTNGCTETETNLTSCEVNSEVAEPTETYVPAYTGAVFNIGNQFISASHFQYNNDIIGR